MVIPRIWLLLSIPLLALAAWGIVATALHLVRVMRASVIARVPIRAEQIVELPASPHLLLSVEQRVGRRRIDVPTFALTPLDGGTPLSIDRRVFPSYVRVNSRLRTPVGDFGVTHPGPYVLRVPQADPSDVDAMLVIGPPSGARIVGHVLPLIVLGFVLIGALIVTVGASLQLPFVSTTTTTSTVTPDG